MQRKTLIRKTCRGMTLVEVIFVMAILSVVMLAVMSLYIPAQRSTVVQTQVTDIQTNLQMAMKRITQDLLTAGFLATGEPVIFENGTDNPTDFTIRTRLVGGGFGRVSSVEASAETDCEVRLNLTTADMAAEFPLNSQVRLFEPVSTRECDEDNEADAAKRVYRVAKVTTDDNGTAGDPSDDFAVVDLDDPNTPAELAVGDVAAETVMVRVANAAQPAVQTIRYRFVDSNGDGADDALVRMVNGNTQFLTRNVSGVNFVYNYTDTATPKVQRVDVTLAEQTKELVAGDAIAGAKTRSLQTSVMLRNVY
jgi:prepilin-type N-terminal cleavage/methylation domain-containing protein